MLLQRAFFSTLCIYVWYSMKHSRCHPKQKCSWLLLHFNFIVDYKQSVCLCCYWDTVFGCVRSRTKCEECLRVHWRITKYYGHLKQKSTTIKYTSNDFITTTEKRQTQIRIFWFKFCSRLNDFISKVDLLNIECLKQNIRMILVDERQFSILWTD